MFLMFGCDCSTALHTSLCLLGLGAGLWLTCGAAAHLWLAASTWCLTGQGMVCMMLSIGLVGKAIQLGVDGARKMGSAFQLLNNECDVLLCLCTAGSRDLW